MISRAAHQAGVALSRARLSTKPVNVDLRWIKSMQEARDVQDAAVIALGGDPIGYTLAATSAATSRTLNCHEPVFGKLLDDYVYESGSSLRPPHGTLGMGAQFIFVIGAPLKEPLCLRSVSNSIVSCRMGLQLLGRRVKLGVPLNDWTATADFALDVACVLGPEVHEWDKIESEAIEVSMRMGDHEVARGKSSAIFGNPVKAVLWLARSLETRGATLHAGDIVATGSCTGLTQVVPGQRIHAVFKGHSCVDISLI